MPLALGALSDYATFWHGAGGYSGVALAMKKSAFPDAPAFSHPSYDRETRVVEARAGGVTYASIYLPNGGKDYAAKIARSSKRWTRASQKRAREATSSCSRAT